MTGHNGGSAAPAPFRSGPFAIEPDWIDGNGHLNLAHYITLFDRATDVLWEALGLGARFRATGFGTFAVETHTLYRAELLADDAALVDSVLLGVDAKRLHVAYTMLRARDGAVSAHQELLYLCVDLGSRRVAPWPEAMRRTLAARCTAARPDWVGRSIVMPPTSLPGAPAPTASTAPARDGAAPRHS